MQTDLNEELSVVKKKPVDGSRQYGRGAQGEADKKTKASIQTSVAAPIFLSNYRDPSGLILSMAR